MDIAHDLTQETADLLQTAVWGVEIEAGAQTPVVKLLLADLRGRARDALELLLTHDLYAPDFTDLARSCIGEILRHRDTVAVLVKAIEDGRQAHRMLQQVERRE